MTERPNSAVLNFNWRDGMKASEHAAVYFQDWNRRRHEWSQSTFGTTAERGPVGALKHLEKEAKEAYEETDLEKQKEEIADCVFLVFDAADRAGMTLDEMVKVLNAKLVKNRSRSWPKPTQADVPVEHDRSGEVPA